MWDFSLNLRLFYHDHSPIAIRGLITLCHGWKSERGLKYLIGAHHVVDGLDDLGHLDQVDEAVSVDVVHAKVKVGHVTAALLELFVLKQSKLNKGTN